MRQRTKIVCACLVGVLFVIAGYKLVLCLRQPAGANMAIAEFLSFVYVALLAIWGLFTQSPGTLHTRESFHERAARIYASAAVSDHVFAITETFDLPQDYVTAYGNCQAARMVFCGRIDPRSPTVLGALARVGILCNRPDGHFMLHHIPDDLIGTMPPKLAGSTQAVALGEPLAGTEPEQTHEGGTQGGWDVRWPALGQYFCRRIEELAGRMEDGETRIAEELDRMAVAPQQRLLVDKTPQELLKVLVNDGEVSKFWGPEKDRVAALAAAGLRHVVGHCRRLKLVGDKTVLSS